MYQPAVPTREDGGPMALTTQTMTDEQRKSVALEYLKAFDNGGVTSAGGSILASCSATSAARSPRSCTTTPTSTG
jgi:hypothetical protein